MLSVVAEDRKVSAAPQRVDLRLYTGASGRRIFLVIEGAPTPSSRRKEGHGEALGSL